MARGRGSQQFTVMGQRIAEELQPLFAEAKLEENSQEAVALAVADTLNKVPIEPGLLAERDLNPTILAHYLQAKYAKIATRDFSAAETALYLRLVNELCSNIVDIASQLP